MRVGERDGGDDALRDFCHVCDERLGGAWWECRSCFDEVVREECERVCADAECACDEDERDGCCTERFELPEAVGIFERWCALGEAPGEEGDEVAQEVCEAEGRSFSFIFFVLNFEVRISPDALCPASASKAAEFMYQPAIPFAPVSPTLTTRPNSVIRLPRSPFPRRAWRMPSTSWLGPSSRE